MKVLGAMFSAAIAAYLVYGPSRGEGQASSAGLSMNMAGTCYTSSFTMQ